MRSALPVHPSKHPGPATKSGALGVVPHTRRHPHETEAKGYSIITDDDDCLDSPTFCRLAMQGLLMCCRFGTKMVASTVMQTTAKPISVRN